MSARLNFADFVFEFMTAIMKKQLWPATIEISKLQLKHGEEPKPSITVSYGSKMSNTEVQEIEKEVVALRDDYSNIVINLHLRKDGLCVCCNENDEM